MEKLIPEGPETQTLDSMLDVLTIARVRLTVVKGPGTGRSFESTHDRISIGCHRSNDVVLRDPRVSRFHCEISLEDGKAILCDLSSRNGTWVDTVRVERCYLAPVANIRLGNVELRYQVLGEQTSLPITRSESFGLLRGRSNAMRKAFARLQRASLSDAPVLIIGEVGTGKDLAASAIHELSPRREGRFVPFACEIAATDVVDPHLFGTPPSTFRASVGRRGALEKAAGGTLYLDHIDSLSSATQTRLAQCLEAGQIDSAGNQPTKLDVRVVASSRRDLRQLANERRFKTALYERCAVIEVRLPPLRDRLEDLPELVASIIETSGLGEDSVAQSFLSASGLKRLGEHSWPGNVRELRRHIERSCALAEVAPLEPAPAPDDPPPVIDTSVPLRVGRAQWSRHFERRYLERLMREHGGNVSASARSAGIDRVHFYRLLARAGLR